MARHTTQVVAPDGSVHPVVFPQYYVHTRAVLGYMRLRRALPKINPDDEHEEVRWEKFKAWVLIGSTTNDAQAQDLILRQGYRNVTEQTVVIPIEPPVKTPTVEEEVVA